MSTDGNWNDAWEQWSRDIGGKWSVTHLEHLSAQEILLHRKQSGSFVQVHCVYNQRQNGSAVE